MGRFLNHNTVAANEGSGENEKEEERVRKRWGLFISFHIILIIKVPIHRLHCSVLLQWQQLPPSSQQTDLFSTTNYLCSRFP